MPEPPTQRSSFLDELKRRKVVRVAVVYGAVAFAVLQLVDLVAEPLRLPAWTMTLFVVLAAAGLPIALALGWAFDLGPQGVTRTTGAGTGSTEAAPSERTRSVSPGEARGHGWFSPTSLAAVTLFAAVGVGGWWLGRSTAPDTGGLGASLAVLPFHDLSADAANRPFTDGLHDDLLTQLSKIRSLRVTSRTSVQEYRDTEKSIPLIAEELGVAAVLEGGVQRAGDRLRINVQLIDGATDEHVWAETYDRDLTVADIFDIQSQIATAITDALRAELTEAERRDIAEEPTDDFEAYTAYLAGLEAGIWMDGDSAALLFEEATTRDPAFAEAWAAAARAWSWQARLFVEDIAGTAQWEEYRAAAERALNRAQALAPGARETRLARGYFQYYAEWDFDAAARTFERLLSEYPNDAAMHQATALVYRRQGRWDEALARLREAMRLDPRDSNLPLDVAVTLTDMRRYEEAERVARLAIARDPESWRLRKALAEVLAAAGAPAAEVETLIPLERDPAVFLGTRLTAGGEGLRAFYERARSLPAENWLTPGERYPTLALFGYATGDSAGAAAYADSTVRQFAALDGLDVSPGDPLAERRAPANAYARRGISRAILGRRDGAVADLRRSAALRRMGEDYAEDARLAKWRADGWAILGMADDFFAELEPYAAQPGDFHARDLIDHPIRSRFADDPRNDALIRSMRD
ncbi:MAG TPA: tetratricopeptide repeat protein [Longimicrobiales bacterium]|nr:tetratricopeptide repeat protein [Longimicrobiales bacterium]